MDSSSDVWFCFSLCIVHEKDLPPYHFTLTNLKFAIARRKSGFQMFFPLLQSFFIIVVIILLTEHLPYDWRSGFFRQHEECPQGWIEADLFIDFHFIVSWLIPIKKKREQRSIGETVLVRKNYFFLQPLRVCDSKSKLNSKNIEREVFLFVFH